MFSIVTTNIIKNVTTIPTIQVRLAAMMKHLHPNNEEKGGSRPAEPERRERESPEPKR